MTEVVGLIVTCCQCVHILLSFFLDLMTVGATPGPDVHSRLGGTSGQGRWRTCGPLIRELISFHPHTETILQQGPSVDKALDSSSAPVLAMAQTCYPQMESGPGQKETRHALFPAMLQNGGLPAEDVPPRAASSPRAARLLIRSSRARHLACSTARLLRVYVCEYGCSPNGKHAYLQLTCQQHSR